jgi:hypothetical protein
MQNYKKIKSSRSGKIFPDFKGLIDRTLKQISSNKFVPAFMMEKLPNLLHNFASKHLYDQQFINFISFHGFHLWIIYITSAFQVTYRFYIKEFDNIYKMK